MDPFLEKLDALAQKSPDFMDSYEASGAFYLKFQKFFTIKVLFDESFSKWRAVASSKLADGVSVTLNISYEENIIDLVSCGFSDFIRGHIEDKD